MSRYPPPGPVLPPEDPSPNQPIGSFSDFGKGFLAGLLLANFNKVQNSR